ncbi:MAG: universal stress protein [Solirubrobacterales bacterium]
MARSGRGRHKVFLGMAAGVGKTYRMLAEGGEEQRRGRDVLIAYLEPHGRVDTIAQAEGLEELARRRVPYRETTLEEMDLPAIFERAPDLALIDELAHSNAPGLEHAKRFEDIDDVLEAGIDVFSTVNVQHLESLNDRVADLTGVRVRETFPDKVLTDADEVVLIDLTPEALIERLRAGKIYPEERVSASLNNFFRIENLAVLRELALRQTAEEVEAKARPHRAATAPGRGEEGGEHPAGGSPSVAERVLALVTLEPRSQRIVRRAARSAHRIGADLDVLHVQPPGSKPDASEREQLGILRRLAEDLRARMLVEEGDDVAAVAAEVASERGVTYVMVGCPRRRSGVRRWREPLAERLMRRIPGADVRIVADPESPARSE